MPRKKSRRKSPDEIRKNMAAIRSTGNITETALRKTLHGLGLRYRKYSKLLPGKPDIVFPKARVVVFVDGDYWHARSLRESGLSALKARLRRENKDYWLKKFLRRIEIDNEVTSLLQQEGWTVIRLWESEVKADIESSAGRIARMVRRRARS